MRSLEKIVSRIVIALIFFLLAFIVINNLYIKSILNLWQDINSNSRRVVESYYDGEANIRNMKNLLQISASLGGTKEEGGESLRSYRGLRENLDEISRLTSENIKLIDKLNRYIYYNRVFKTEDLKIEMEDLYDEIDKIRAGLEEWRQMEYVQGEEVVNSSYEKYIGSKLYIDNFNMKIEEINSKSTNNLINTENRTMAIIFLVVILLIYFGDKIVRRNVKYMMYSLEMLNNNNYNISILPHPSASFEEEKRMEENIEEIFRERQFIAKIKEILGGEYILDEIIDKLLELVKDPMDTNRIGIAYIDYKKGEIIAEHGAFDYGRVLLGPGFKVDIESSSLKDMIESQKGIITRSIPEELKKRPASPSLRLLDEEGIKSNMIIPLVLNKIVFGYLFFSSLSENNYDEGDLELGEKIAQEISGILNTTYLTKKMFISTTNAFANLVEKKDNDTGDHILRMTYYSRIIAKGLINHEKCEYRVDQGYVNDITNYAPIHDIGKVGIPDSILKKPGKLTAEERRVMETHTDIGGDILEEVQDSLRIFNRKFFQMAMEIARGHHEKWDGTGYPIGQSGNEIPLSARIVAIADVFDALSSKRVYKDDFGFEKSVEIMNQGAGKHFDPELIRVFNKKLPEIKEVYEEHKPI